MMSRILIVTVFFYYSISMHAQSLVPNGGFEEYAGYMHCRYWTQAMGDFNHFYHNHFMPQNGGAAEGEGYHCLCMYGFDENEFMHVALTKKLQRGQRYRLSMKVRISNTADKVHKTDLIGKLKRLDWYFTNIPINVLYKLFITAEPSASFAFKAPHPLTWVTMETEYTATGEEAFLTIGNVTRIYEKIKHDALLDSLKNQLLLLEEKEKREIDSVRNLYAEQLTSNQPNYEDDYSMNSLVEKKKRKKRKNKQDTQAIDHNRELGRKIGEQQYTIRHNYQKQKTELITQIETTKKSYAVNVCFDDVSIEPIPGQTVASLQTLADVIPEQGKTMVLKNIQFNTDAYELLPGSTQQLDELVEWLKQYPTVNIQLNGHTDNTGEEKHNLELSANRAMAAKNYLMQKGIAENRLKSAGYGSKYALADNLSPFGRALNRRVEFTVL